MPNLSWLSNPTPHFLDSWYHCVGCVICHMTQIGCMLCLQVACLWVPSNPPLRKRWNPWLVLFRFTSRFRSWSITTMSACITHDIVLIQGKTAKDRAKAREAHLMTLKQSFAHSSTSDSCIMIITNASVPLLSTGYQAVVVWHTWHSDHYVENSRSGGLAISNDAETNAIGGALKALSDSFNSISDINEIHIYSDSTYVLHHMLDPSIHSVQLYALESLSILFSWIEKNTNYSIFLHHVPDCENYVFEPHHVVHCLATSTKIEAGRAPAQTITFSTKQIIDSIMSDWANQFQLSQYIGQHFIYSRSSIRRQDHAKAKCMIPLHLNSGTWPKDVGHSLLLTVQIVHSLISHAPIEHYRKQFKVGNQDESCPYREGGAAETF